MNGLLRTRRPYRGLSLLLAGSLALLTLADDEPVSQNRLPRLPAKDFAGQTACDVLRVLSGNAIVIERDGKPTAIRLIGTYVPRADGDVAEAGTFLSRLLEAESVYVESEPDWPARDQDGRTWAYVYRAPDGLFVNLELIRQGYARVAGAGPFAQQPLLEAYEKHARDAHKGLWRDPVTARATTQPTSKPSRNEVGKDTSDRTKTGGGITVYVTKHGRKYHRKDCQHVRKSAIPMTLKEAKAKGYTPCSRCKPPR